MKKLYLNLLAAFCVCITVSAQEFPVELSGELQTILDNQISGNVLKGVAATVILNDGIEWTGVSGIAHPDDPVDTTRLWDLVNLSQSAIAVTLLSLQEEGILSLEDSIGMYLPELGDRINLSFPISRFMNHTSGTGEYWSPGTPLWGNVFSDREKIWTLEEAAQYIPPWSVSPEPDYQASLSNPLLLAMVIEQATGTPIGEVIRERVFDPLHLDHSYIASGDFDESDLNGVWNYNNGNPADYGDLSQNSFMTSRCGWVGKIDESARFTRALHMGELLEASSMEQLYMADSGSMETLPSPIGDLLTSYGHGVSIINHNDTLFYGNGGSGLSQVLSYHSPIDSLTISVVSNVFYSELETTLFFTQVYESVKAFQRNNTEGGDDDGGDDGGDGDSVGVAVENATYLNQLMLYPNPTTGYLNIRLSDNDVKGITVCVMDQSGRILSRFEDTELSRESHLARLHLPDTLGNGFYLVRVNTGKNMFTKPFILNR